MPAGPGLHSYAVHAFDADGADYPLGSRTVAVDEGDGALGQVERLEAFGRTVRISGWAFDPDHPADELPVSVYRDGALLSQHRTGQARPDVNRDYGAAGDHGFDLVLAAVPGTAQLHRLRRPGSTGVRRPAPPAGSLIGGRTVISDDLPAEVDAEVLG